MFVVAGCIIAAGCSPPSQSALDEQKEPHFVEGRNRVAALDFKGAVEAYERALQSNPHSASAHFELGLLCEQNESDYAAAIYHYEKFLKLRPNSDYTEKAHFRITACKQELAKTVTVGPLKLPVQQDFDKLAAENGRLREELESCRKSLAASAAIPNSPAVVQTSVRPPPGNNPQPATQTSLPVNNTRTTRVPPVTTAVSRTHTVAPGETPSIIARKYGLRVEVLMAANPGVDARRLQIGKSLNLPGS
jgi:LysM repeat protein